MYVRCDTLEFKQGRNAAESTRIIYFAEDTSSTDHNTVSRPFNRSGSKSLDNQARSSWSTTVDS